jgi:hypothetical protein
VLIALREINVILSKLVMCKTQQEFIELRKNSFPDYVNLSHIIANSFAMTADHSIRRSATTQAIDMLEQMFRAEALSRFGPEVGHEALFCLTVLRRAYRLLDEVLSRGPVAAEKIEHDRKLSSRFNISAQWAQMHLGCLVMLFLEGRETLAQEVLTEIMRGLRVAVLAYAYVREALELRTVQAPYLSDTEQDDEDRELLNDQFDEIESL